MAKIAIDVVLLLSDEMMDKAIEINKELLKDFEGDIILDKEKCLLIVTPVREPPTGGIPIDSPDHIMVF